MQSGIYQKGEEDRRRKPICRVPTGSIVPEGKGHAFGRLRGEQQRGGSGRQNRSPGQHVDDGEALAPRMASARNDGMD